MKSLFVTNPLDLDSALPGGVQICSREFLQILEQASTELQSFPIGISRTPILRLRRRFKLGSYLLYTPGNWEPSLEAVLRSYGPTHVFLNKAELIRFAPLVKRLRPETKVVVMSHGTQTGDDLYDVAGPEGRVKGRIERLKSIWQLGLDLTTESWIRHRWIDAACVMSQEEAVLERWLGVRQTIVLPRMVTPAFVDWSPVPSRVGYVGTLDHTPNRAALEEVCLRVAKTRCPFELHVVGRPESVGRALAAKYPCVCYLGGLGHAELRAAASSWSLFLNPIFWLARGASMKLGQGLALGLPVLTTASGARGYEAQEGTLSQTPDDPGEFVRLLLALLSQPARLQECRAQSRLFARSTPDAKELASRLSLIATS